MRKKIIATAQAPDGSSYSPAVAVEAQRLTFFSAIAPSSPRPFADEANEVIDRLHALLDAAGLTPDNLVKLTVYLLDMDQRPALESALGRIVGERPPAVTEVEVSWLPQGGSVAIDAIAAS
jgi:enamine deaminase RidA (YjgF/YER057c/UK114 family)